MIFSGINHLNQCFQFNVLEINGGRTICFSVLNTFDRPNCRGGDGTQRETASGLPLDKSVGKTFEQL